MRRAVAIAVAAAAVAAARPALHAGEPVPAQARTARLEGTASLDRHHHAAGVTVLASAGRSLLWLTSTDDRGFFTLDGLPEGRYRVELSRDGLAPVIKDAVEVRFPFRAVVEVMLAPRQAAEVRAAQGGAGPAKRVRLTGAVSARGKGPLGEARVRLLRRDAACDPRSIVSSRDGTFAVEDVPAGPWRIVVLGPGYLPVRMDLDLEDDARVEAILVPQPASYAAPALDLLPEEEAIPPPAR
jgi:hypothetical protein